MTILDKSLTPNIFDKIDETEPNIGSEIQLTDALQKIDLWSYLEGKPYNNWK